MGQGRNDEEAPDLEIGQNFLLKGSFKAFIVSVNIEYYMVQFKCVLKV